MRIIGLVLVLLGALALGYESFSYAARELVGDRVGALGIPPVVGWIAVVSGLLLVASDSRRGEN
jgi:hypothetical protein